VDIAEVVGPRLLECAQCAQCLLAQCPLKPIFKRPSQKQVFRFLHSEARAGYAMAESESAWIPFAAEGVGTSRILHGAAHATAVLHYPTCVLARSRIQGSRGGHPEPALPFRARARLPAVCVSPAPCIASSLTPSLLPPSAAPTSLPTSLPTFFRLFSRPFASIAGCFVPWADRPPIILTPPPPRARAFPLRSQVQVRLGG
jgi:hypothetical protein